MSVCNQSFAAPLASLVATVRLLLAEPRNILTERLTADYVCSAKLDPAVCEQFKPCEIGE